MHRAVVAFVTLAACGPATREAASPPPPPAQAPAFTGYDLANLDRGVDPCDDFYAFACGGWLKRNEIPPDRSRWISFSEIEERNLATLRRILDDAAAGRGDPRTPYLDKLRAFHAACMDEAAIEASTPADVGALLAAVDRVRDPATLAAYLARAHLDGTTGLFAFGSQQDFRDSTRVIGVADQGGLGLPDRDYYVKEDARSLELLAKYREHVARTLVLAGAGAAEAERDAGTVLRIETALARASLTRTDRRDPLKVYHRIELAGLKKAAPRLPWDRYLDDLGRAGLTEINVAVPGFFEEVNRLLKEVRIGEWRAYLRWHVLRRAAPLLSGAFVDESFGFFGRTLNGEQELQPRWKRCVQAADRALGEALAAAFVAIAFSPEAKAMAEELVAAVEEAMKEDIAALPWMDAATREQAYAKLAAVANKIGYPAKWRSYDGLDFGRASHLANSLAAARFESRRQLDKIGRPVDRTEWKMTPPTVNAYYSGSLNEMVFPAGILQPPFFSPAARPAVNYGAIGMVVAHELTHGFDDKGRKFDGGGNLRDWWSPDVGKEFDRRSECVVTQYEGYVAVDDLRLNGRLTLGENIADLGGLKLAYAALAKSHPPQPAAAAGGFDDRQLLFLGAAQAWCGKTRPENARLRVTVDPHSPPLHRINGPLSNLPEFAEAFGCKPGDRMVRQERCEVW
jgi:predicted metalloendopeptidase